MAPVPRNFVRENREWRCLADDRFRVAGVVDQPPPLCTHMALKRPGFAGNTTRKRA